MPKFQTGKGPPIELLRRPPATARLPNHSLPQGQVQIQVKVHPQRDSQPQPQPQPQPQSQTRLPEIGLLSASASASTPHSLRRKIGGRPDKEDEEGEEEDEGKSQEKKVERQTHKVQNNPPDKVQEEQVTQQLDTQSLAQTVALCMDLTLVLAAQHRLTLERIYSNLKYLVEQSQRQQEQTKSFEAAMQASFASLQDSKIQSRAMRTETVLQENIEAFERTKLWLEKHEEQGESLKSELLKLGASIESLSVFVRTPRSVLKRLSGRIGEEARVKFGSIERVSISPLPSPSSSPKPSPPASPESMSRRISQSSVSPAVHKTGGGTSAAVSAASSILSQSSGLPPLSLGPASSSGSISYPAKALRDHRNTLMKEINTRRFKKTRHKTLREGLVRESPV